MVWMVIVGLVNLMGFNHGSEGTGEGSVVVACHLILHVVVTIVIVVASLHEKEER